MKKFIKKILLYGVACFIMANLLALGALIILRNSDMYKPSFLKNNYPAGTEFDYITLGSSIVFTGIDTSLADSLLGLKGLNLGLDGMAYEGQLMMLDFFLDQGYMAEYCILGVNGIVNEKESESINEFYFLPFIDKPYIYNSFASREKGLVKIKAYTRYFPILGTAYYNQQLFFSSVRALANSSYRHHFDEKGNMGYPTAISMDKPLGDLKYVPLEPANEAFLEIEKRCRDNNISIIYYIPPVAGQNFIVSQEWASHKSIVNLSELFYGEEEKYMYDTEHVNSAGRREATIALCDTIRNRGLFSPLLH